MPPTFDPSVGMDLVDLASNLWQLAVLPIWLLAALQAEQIGAALRRQVPDFASGMLELRGCSVKCLLLKETDGRWSGDYIVTMADKQSGQERTVMLEGTLTAPQLRRPAYSVDSGKPVAFGSADWRCLLPEFGLELATRPPATVLVALPQLTDPEQSRALMEQAMRAGSPAYADLRLTACTPEMLSDKAGRRATICYHLEFPPELADHGWPTTVIGKTYRQDSKARNAYTGMQKLWATALAKGDIVTIAEPLAYVPELKLMLQAPIAEEQTLKELLKSTLLAGTTDQMDLLKGFVRKTATGLAAIHQSGVIHGETATVEGNVAAIRKMIGRLVVPEPALGAAAEPLLACLESYGMKHPPDPVVPTHGTFTLERVLIDREHIGIIDFDDFCMAEPALDVGLFCAAIYDAGMSSGDVAFFANRAARQARLEQLDTLCQLFVDEYTRHVPISKERVALWQALDFMRNCLNYWVKVEPAEPDTPMLVLEHMLRAMGLYEAHDQLEARRRDALKGSAGLTGVQWMLSGAEPHAALCHTLARLLPTPAQLDDCQLYRAKYKPGRHLTTYYAATIRDPVGGTAHTRHVEAIWRPSGMAHPQLALDDRTIQEDVQQRGLAAPLRQLSAVDLAWNLGLRISPLDPGFPQIARLSDPAYVCSILDQEYSVSVVRYRPGQRHVLRYDPISVAGEGGPGSLFAKIYNSDKGQRTFDVVRTVADWLESQGAPISTVRPQAYLADDQTVLYPWVSGTPLSWLLQTPGPATDAQIRLAGEALRAMHSIPLDLIALQPHSLAKEIKGIASAAEHIHPLLAATGRQITRILEQAQALHERLPQEPPGFAYGDYKSDHLWLTPNGLTLIDFDTCYLFDPAIDLGKYLSDLRWWYDSYGLQGVEQAQAIFLEGYADGAGRMDRARLYEVLVLVKTIARRIKLFDADWAERTARLIDNADQLLQNLEATIAR